MHNIIQTKPLLNTYNTIFVNPQSIYKDLHDYFIKEDIISSLDDDIINPYTKDWSNIQGYASLLVQPKSSFECAIIDENLDDEFQEWQVIGWQTRDDINKLMVENG